MIIKTTESHQVEFTLGRFLLNTNRNIFDQDKWDYEFRMKLIDSTGEVWITKRILPYEDYQKVLRENNLPERDYSCLMQQEMYNKIIGKIRLRNHINLVMENNRRKVSLRLANKDKI